MQYRPARHQHLQFGHRGEQLRDYGRCIYYLLKVVQNKQQMLVSQEIYCALDHGAATGFADTEGLSDQSGYEVRVSNRSKVGKEHSIVEVVYYVSRNLKSQASLAGTARACQRDQAALGFEQQIA